MTKSFHIIIADDDEDDQFIIKQAIEEVSSQVKITAVTDGVQLMNCLNGVSPFPKPESTPDLIILDINMPKMNGMEALEKIKTSVNLSKIPVCMLSTLRTIERVDKSMALGAMHFYSKPNEFRDYKPILTEIFESTMYSV